jgi:hypothetical protein
MCLLNVFSEIGFLPRTTYLGDAFLIKTQLLMSGRGASKSANHLFFNCDFFSSIWWHGWHWIGFSLFDPSCIFDHFMQIGFLHTVQKFDDILCMLFGFLVFG